MKSKLLVIIGLLAILIALLFVAFFLAGASSTQGSQAQFGDDSKTVKASACREVTATATVIMKDEGYEPKDLNIAKCTRVTFKNGSGEALWPASDIHPTHGIYPEFDPREPVEAGGEWSFVFDRAGRWKYHDHLKPTIRGVIEVLE